MRKLSVKYGKKSLLKILKFNIVDCFTNCMKKKTKIAEYEKKLNKRLVSAESIVVGTIRVFLEHLNG